MLTSVKDEAIDTDFLIACNAHSLYQFFFVAYRCQCTHEPAVAVVALSYIVRGRAFYEEFRAVKDVLSYVSSCACLRVDQPYLNSLD
jgi:hypothetical protein